MNDSSEVTKETIIDWAIQQATFEELEEVAKALYGIYAQRRKNDYPELHKINKAKRKELKRLSALKKTKHLPSTGKKIFY